MASTNPRMPTVGAQPHLVGTANGGDTIGSLIQAGLSFIQKDPQIEAIEKDASSQEVRESIVEAYDDVKYASDNYERKERAAAAIDLLRQSELFDSDGKKLDEEQLASYRDVIQSIDNNTSLSAVDKSLTRMTTSQGIYDCGDPIEVSLNPICKNIYASLYMSLSDIRKGVNERLKLTDSIRRPLGLRQTEEILREAAPEIGPLFGDVPGLLGGTPEFETTFEDLYNSQG